MYLARLALNNFRNYRRLDLAPVRGVTLITGANAQGKTNLLEAVYLLATTRPARGGSEAELIRWNAAAEGLNAARVIGEAERKHGPVAVEVVVAGKEPGAGPAGAVEHASKRLKVNGVPRRASEVIGQLTAVLFTAEDIELITGPPAARRRYLDITISQTDGAYVRSLQRYARVLLQRNSLLRRIGDGQASPEELGYWDDELVREGARIMHVRATTMQSLRIAGREYHAKLSDGREDLEVAYAPQTALPDDNGAVERAIELKLRGSLSQLRRREIAGGVTLVGPHRDDLSFTLNGVALSAYGSRAQQRTAALALRLAETAFLNGANQDPPILLLDDILSELDESRRQAVMRLMHDAEQVFVTTAEPERFDQEFLRAATVYEVRGGELALASVDEAKS
ncbi:MAG: DNA replication/repair protein RecF [Dehalococcoidia bacterium]